MKVADKACHCANEGEAAKVKVNEKKVNMEHNSETRRSDKVCHCATEEEAAKVKMNQT